MMCSGGWDLVVGGGVYCSLLTTEEIIFPESVHILNMLEIQYKVYNYFLSAVRQLSCTVIAPEEYNACTPDAGGQQEQADCRQKTKYKTQCQQVL